jgi:hypothetical protein
MPRLFVRMYRLNTSNYLSGITEKSISILVFILLFGNALMAQRQKDFELWGDQAVIIKDYYGAALYYKKAFDLDSSQSRITWKYAEALRGFNNYKDAEFYYNKIYRKDQGRLFPEGPFWLATMMKHNGKYAESKKIWKKVANQNKKDKDSYTYLKAIQEYESCDSAMKYSNQRTEAEIANIGEPLNTFDAEFSPMLDAEGNLYFASLKGKLGPNNEVIGKKYEINLFSAEKDGKNWKPWQELDSLINKPGYHTANPAFDLSGKYFFYTQCTDSMVCQIMVADYANHQFTNTRPADTWLNHPNCRNTQPSFAIVNGQEYLFFSSDRPGGFGKLDIWYARHLGGLQFEKPINAGGTLNSIDNEITPWYDAATGKLFFSSDWHYGMGGYDVFASEGFTGNWSRPKNMLTPINSGANDFYYSYSAKHEKGFVVSNREGSLAAKGETCCNDIYLITYPQTDSLPVIETLEQLSDYLPVTLYFHNDEPNPRSWDTTTTLNYMDSYVAYRAMLPTYQDEYSKGLRGDKSDEAILNITDFFEKRVDLGVEHLELFTKLLLRELEKGRKIDLTVKGYASPLAKSDYNINLTQRRIQSLVNYLRAYNRGVFVPYMDDIAGNGGELNIKRIPFGEYRAQTEVSDNLNDKKNSVYSRNAALERKIEILSIDRAAGDSAIAQINFKSQIHNFGSVQQSDTLLHQFIFTNRGELPLRLAGVTTDCDCATVKYPDFEIAPGSESYIEILFKGIVGEGNYTRSFTVKTNGMPQSVELVITAEIGWY